MGGDSLRRRTDHARRQRGDGFREHLGRDLFTGCSPEMTTSVSGPAGTVKMRDAPAPAAGPAFDIPFSPTLPSPAVSDQRGLRAWQHSWLAELRVLSGEGQCHTVDRWRIPHFVQLTSPTCRTEEGARLTCAWTTWLHLFDDEFDAPSISHDPRAAEVVVSPYLEYIADARTGEVASAASDNGLLRAFVALNRWTVGPMSRAWIHRWFDDLSDYIRAYVTETIHRATGTILPPEELIAFKRVCMAQRPAMDLIERVATGELSPAARALTTPAIDIVADITGALNDPASLARERACGDTHNLILSLGHHRSMSEQDAIEYLVQFVSRRCRDLAHAIQETPMDPAAQDEREAVAEWMASCGHWARGYHDWLLATGRY